MQKKILLAFMLFGSIATAGVQAQTKNEQEPDSIEIGDFTKFMDEGDSGNNDRTYFDGIPNFAPGCFAFEYTGSQIIYTKDELQAVAGKEITAIKYLYINEGGFAERNFKVKAYLQEIDENKFVKNEDKNKYEYFDFDATLPQSSFDYTFSGSDSYGQNVEFKLPIEEPFFYSGKKNLLVTVVVIGGDNSDSFNYSDVRFFKIKDVKNKFDHRAMTFASDNRKFEAFHESAEWPIDTKDTGVDVDQPVTKFIFRAKSIPNGISTASTSVDTPFEWFSPSGVRVTNPSRGIFIRKQGTSISKVIL